MSISPQAPSSNFFFSCAWIWASVRIVPFRHRCVGPEGRGRPVVGERLLPGKKPPGRGLQAGFGLPANRDGLAFRAGRAIRRGKRHRTSPNPAGRAPPARGDPQRGRPVPAFSDVPPVGRISPARPMPPGPADKDNRAASPPAPCYGRNAGCPAPPVVTVGMRIAAHPPRRSGRGR